MQNKEGVVRAERAVNWCANESLNVLLSPRTRSECSQGQENSFWSDSGKFQPMEWCWWSLLSCSQQATQQNSTNEFAHPRRIHLLPCLLLPIQHATPPPATSHDCARICLGNNICYIRNCKSICLKTQLNESAAGGVPWAAPGRCGVGISFSPSPPSHPWPSWWGKRETGGDQDSTRCPAAPVKPKGGSPPASAICFSLQER